MSLGSPPFVTVEGVINIRSVGGFATSNEGLVVKANAFFRSGELSYVTEKGKEQLRALGIKKIFDLRSPTEIKNYNTSAPTIEGIELVCSPIIPNEALDQEKLRQRLKDFATDERETFVSVYRENLNLAGRAYGLILAHIRDHPEVPCLVHCTAGKDRTGVFTCLLLMILGVGDEDIAYDHALTAVGLAPVYDMLAERFSKQDIFKDNIKGTENMGSSKYENMLATIEMIRSDYGGAEEYITGHTTLTDADIEKIRSNLLVPKA
ncbi:hypothetical protein HYDPIDRAFT_85094 [Hydnomerulius pinastri MD-312]|nr:hypothetical protein HYDPIDRAFT_85094 [Hydnomerulius pinastri MD-312]